MSYIFKVKVIYIANMSYIFKVKVISGICFKQTFLCVEQLYHISLKYQLYVEYVSKKNSLY